MDGSDWWVRGSVADDEFFNELGRKSGQMDFMGGGQDQGWVGGFDLGGNA